LVDDGTFYNPSVLIDSGGYDFSNAAFDFRADASGNADKVYIDDMVISAFSRKAMNWIYSTPHSRFPV